VGYWDSDKFKVIASEVTEHRERAMLDGQIHNIGLVSEAVESVKGKLEKRLGTDLKQVAIAAAGRALKTCRVKVEREIDPYVEIDQKYVSSLEIEAMQKAQALLDIENRANAYDKFYCIGYSVVNYYLNDYMITSLIGHKGNKIGAEILATFLPHMVIDSLYSVINKVGLEVSNLTLEPIAAINVAIPSDLRLLNLALVDIGAGTSDIAITRDGSVIAYAMASIAGDEITEKIAQHYLVDFNTAEKLKISLSTGKETVTFQDILGKKNSVSVKEIGQVIEEPLQLLAKTICDEILFYNKKAPNAVFLIGGGSMVPGLDRLISKYLGLPEGRVVVRGRDIIRNIKFSGKKLSGPESITPIGIAVTAHMQRGQDFLTLTVNGKKVRLFNSKKLAVSDVLVLSGFNPDDLIGRRGENTVFEVNGEKRVVRGEPGKAAEIFINGTEGNLHTQVNAGDEITINPAQHGKRAEIKAADLVNQDNEVEIILNGGIVRLQPKVFINGKAAGPEERINDGDSVMIEQVCTLDELITMMDIDREKFEIFVNGEKINTSCILRTHDKVECIPVLNNDTEIFTEPVKGPDIYTESPAAESGSDTKDDGAKTITDNNEETMRVTVNGNTVEIKGKKDKVIFVDIFNFIDFDLSKPLGNIVLKLNGKNAAYTDKIKNGDVIEVYWKQ